jgi:hypothetical protein
MIAFILGLQASVQCVPNALGVRCTTSPTYTYQPPVNYYDQFQRGVEQQQQRNATATAALNRQIVGNMLAKGNCAGAEQYALKSGELDIAQQVKSYCGK